MKFVFLLLISLLFVAMSRSIKTFEWENSCNLFISEVKFHLPTVASTTTRQEYIELYRLCEKYPAREKSLDLKHFYLIIMDLRINKLLVSCKLNAKTTVLDKKKDEETQIRNFFVLGTSSLEKSNLKVNDIVSCQSSLANIDSFPSIDVAVISVALLKIQGSDSFIDLSPIGRTGKYSSIILTDSIRDDIVRTLHDVVFFSKLSPYRNYPFLNKMYTKIHGSDAAAFISRLQLYKAKKDKSLNRCTLLTVSGYPEFLERDPSPLAPNKCDITSDSASSALAAASSSSGAEGTSSNTGNTIIVNTASNTGSGSSSSSSSNPSTSSAGSSSSSSSSSNPSTNSAVITSSSSNPSTNSAGSSSSSSSSSNPSTSSSGGSTSSSSSSSNPSTSSSGGSTSSSSSSSNNPSTNTGSNVVAGSCPGSRTNSESPTTNNDSSDDEVYVEDMDIDEVDEPVEPTCAIEELPNPYITWKSCEVFTRAWLTQIKDHQSTVVDTNTLMKVEICSWVQYVFNFQSPVDSQMYCRPCANALEKKVIRETKGSVCRTKATKRTGFLVTQKSPNSHTVLKTENSKTMIAHSKSKIHLMSTYYYKALEMKLKGQAMTNFLLKDGSPIREFYKKTEQLFYAVFVACRMRISFESFNELTTLLNHYKVPIGSQFQDARGMKRMVTFISDNMLRELVEYLTTEDVKVSLILDSSVDIDGFHVLASAFFVCDKYFNTKVIFYKYMTLPSGTAQGMFDKLSKNYKDDKLYALLKLHLTAISTDGAVVMKDTLMNLIKEDLRAGTPMSNNVGSILPIWCAAHIIELTYKHAFERFPYIQSIDDSFNDLYRFFSKSSYKNRDKLKSVTKDELDSTFSLKRLYNIRWINNRYRCATTILDHYKSIAQALLQISADESFAKSARHKAQELYTVLTDASFLLHLAFIADITDAYKTTSLKFQLKTITIVDKKQAVSELWNKISKFSTENGEHMKKLLANLVCGIADEGEELPPCTIEIVESEDRTVTLYGNPINHQFENSPKLSEKRQDYLDAIDLEIVHYHQPGIQDDFEIFNPLQFNYFMSTVEQEIPKSSPTDRTMTTTGEKLCKEAIVRINRFYKILDPNEGSVNNLLDEYQTLVTALKKHVRFEQYKQFNVGIFYRYFRDSSSKVVFPRNIGKMIHVALSIIPVSSDVERFFSYFNIMKTYQRFSLLPETVDSLVRVSHEQEKSLDAFPALKYAMLWSEDNTRADYEVSRKRKKEDEQKLTDLQDPDGILPFKKQLVFPD